MTTPTTNKWRYRRKPFAEQREEDTGYSALAAAIVRQAVDDWRDATKLEKGVIRYSDIGSPVKTKYEIRKFFRSRWYGTLCDIDPQKIMKKLEGEA